MNAENFSDPGSKDSSPATVEDLPLAPAVSSLKVQRVQAPSCCRRATSVPGILLTALLLALLHFSPDPCFSASTKDSPSQVMAIVNGHKITDADVERPIASRLYHLREEIHDLKQAHLTQLIADRLLTDEAKRRGVTLEQLLETEVLSKVKPLSPQELEQYYQHNKASFDHSQASVEEIKGTIEASVRQQRAYQKTLEYAETLKSGANVQVFLQETPLPEAKVAIGNAPVLGNADAPVTIIEFSDYQCPSCKKQHANIQQLQTKYGEKIRWVYKNFPLGLNEGSVQAAIAAKCAREQNKFWEYHEKLFSSTEELNPEMLRHMAAGLQLNMAEFDACMPKSEHRESIMDEVEQARIVGIDRTPSFIINDRLYPGSPTLARLQKIIDRELAAAGSKNAAGKGKAAGK